MNLLVTDRPSAVLPGQLPPAARGDAVRVLFLSLDVLGWSTSSHQLISVAAARKDIVAVHVLVRPPLWMKVLNRHVPGVTDHLFQPNQTWQWLIRRWLTGPLDGRRFDVVHANPQMLAGAPAALKDRLGYRLSVACDTTDRQYRRELARVSVPRTDRDARVFAAADLIASLSTWCARSLADNYGVDSSKILLTPPTVATPLDVVPTPSDDRPKRIVFVGNDFARKGGPRLLAWHQARWAARGVELHVASAEAADHAPAAKVVFHGRLDHKRVIELIRTCDVMVHPTTNDMSALVVAEAATLGVPAVASRLAGIPDLVRDGESGYLVDPHDDQGFIDATERALFDDTLRARLSHGARTFARDVLDTNVVYGRLMDRIVDLVPSPM